MKTICERKNEYDSNYFINELYEASKSLGALEAQINCCQLDNIIIPLLHKKETISSMQIEGTEVTICDAFESKVNPKIASDAEKIEIDNHYEALIYGANKLKTEKFTHNLIKTIHKTMMNGICFNSRSNIGEYKKCDNRIVNSLGKTIYNPPSFKETKKYMDELIDYINDSNDGVNPLIKAAIMHAQFESIHPFEDGNGRVGRLLVSLYLYKTGVIGMPFYYISEAISQDKTLYYSKLSDTRESDYNSWIKYFLRKMTIQAENHIEYIESLNDLYNKTNILLKEKIKSTKYVDIVECIFSQPVLTSKYFAEQLNVSTGQAKRYLEVLEKEGVLHGNDRRRNRIYFFLDLIDIVRR